MLLLLLLLLSLAGPSSQLVAQRAQLTFDNDLIGVRGGGAPPDHDYTGGIRLRWVSGGGLGVVLAQEIYTPRRDGPEPVPGERPYAAWLYGEVVWTEAPAGQRGRRELAVRFGHVGPGALGEEVQNGIHELSGSQPQEGWPHQLRLGSTFGARYRDGFRLPIAGESLSLQPYGEGTVGTVRIGVEVGVPLLFRMHPSLLRPVDGFGAGLTLAMRATARDALLDRSATGVAPVDRMPVIGVATIAAGYRFGHWSVAYGFTLSTREYETQEHPHRYGSLTATWMRDGER